MSSMRGGSCRSPGGSVALGVIALGVIALMAASLPLSAQRGHNARVPPQGVILRGTVVRQDSVTPAPYSSVELVEAHTRHFSDEKGQFSFKAPPGSYHVLVRQLGYQAHDTVITLSASAQSQTLVMRMKAVTIRLSDVTVRAAKDCLVPGVDSEASPTLAQFMTDVRENAHRELLLRQSYPFEYVVQDVRTTSALGAATIDGPAVADTLGYRSDQMMPYGRGSTIFTDRTDPRGGWERMRLPSVMDLADSTFLATHCFDYGVAESGDYEINFRPLAAMTTPDVEGTITLDSLSFVIRRAVVHLTNAGRVAPGFARLEVTTTYRELLPGVALPDVVSSFQEYRTSVPEGRMLVASEVQSLTTLRFLNTAPSGVALHQRFDTWTPAGSIGSAH